MGACLSSGAGASQPTGHPAPLGAVQDQDNQQQGQQHTETGAESSGAATSNGKSPCDGNQQASSANAYVNTTTPGKAAGDQGVAATEEREHAALENPQQSNGKDLGSVLAGEHNEGPVSVQSGVIVQQAGGDFAPGSAMTMAAMEAARCSNASTGSILHTNLPVQTPLRIGRQHTGGEREQLPSENSFSFLRVSERGNSTSVARKQVDLRGPGTIDASDSGASPLSRAHGRTPSWTQDPSLMSVNSGGLASTNSACLSSDQVSLQIQNPEQQSKLQQLSVRELNDEIQDLAYIGQGASGEVYKGLWQGATVAVKYVISQNSNAQAAAANEAVLGRLLAHPNVVQTFSCKAVLLDDPFFQELADLVALKQQQQQHGNAYMDDMDGPPEGGGMIGDGGANGGAGTPVRPPGAPGALPSTPGNPTQNPSFQWHPGGQGAQMPGSPAVGGVGGTPGVHPHHNMDSAVAMAATSFMSGEGFGNPLVRPANVVALQEVLHRANAKPGCVLTQIVMDHCDKGSLLQAIKRGLFRPTSKWGAKLALRALLRTAREVAQGMWHIHCSNVIHGDLKPGNVLLKGSRADRRGFVAKVSDFGLARVADKTMVDSGHWGTVHYMAPESFEGTLTRQADVYAFGVTLWQMVTGEKPYDGLHPGQVIVGVQTGTLHLEWPQDVHPRLLKLGLACLDTDRKKRPNFNYIMKELSIIESMVRLEGARDGGSSDHISSGRSIAAALMGMAGSSSRGPDSDPTVSNPNISSLGSMPNAGAGGMSGTSAVVNVASLTPASLSRLGASGGSVTEQPSSTASPPAPGTPLGPSGGSGGSALFQQGSGGSGSFVSVPVGAGSGRLSGAGANSRGPSRLSQEPEPASFAQLLAMAKEVEAEQQSGGTSGTASGQPPGLPGIPETGLASNFTSKPPTAAQGLQQVVELLHRQQQAEGAEVQ